MEFSAAFYAHTTIQLMCLHGRVFFLEPAGRARTSVPYMNTIFLNIPRFGHSAVCANSAVPCVFTGGATIITVAIFPLVLAFTCGSAPTAFGAATHLCRFQIVYSHVDSELMLIAGPTESARVIIPMVVPKGIPFVLFITSFAALHAFATIPSMCVAVTLFATSGTYAVVPFVLLVPLFTALGAGAAFPLMLHITLLATCGADAAIPLVRRITFQSTSATCTAIPLMRALFSTYPTLAGCVTIIMPLVARCAAPGTLASKPTMLGIPCGTAG